MQYPHSIDELYGELPDKITIANGCRWSFPITQPVLIYLSSLRHGCLIHPRIADVTKLLNNVCWIYRKETEQQTSRIYFSPQGYHKELLKNAQRVHVIKPHQPAINVLWTHSVGLLFVKFAVFAIVINILDWVLHDVWLWCSRLEFLEIDTKIKHWHCEFSQITRDSIDWAGVVSAI